MNAIHKRLQRLEAPLGIVDGKVQEGPRAIFCRAGWGLPLDLDTCLEILSQSGFLLSGPGFSTVNLCDVKDGLTAEEIAIFLREHGAEMCTPVHQGLE